MPLPPARRTALATLLLVASAPAQDLDAVKQRVLDAIGREQPPQQRGLILSRKPAPQPLGQQPAPPTHVCPLCKQPFVGIALRKEPPSIDSAGEWTAHVCERDAMFFVTLHGVGRHAECGPFALPPAGQKVERIALPWGSSPEAATPPWPPRVPPGDDPSAWIADADDGRVQVKNGERTLFREPKDTGSAAMGLLVDAVSVRARLVALARSQGPLVVGDLGSGRVKATMPARGGNFTAAAIAPSGRWVAAVLAEGGDQTPCFRLLDVATGQVREVARGGDHPPSTFVFAEASGLVLAAASTHHGVIEAWPLAGGASKWRATIDGTWTAFRTFTLSPDAKCLLVLTRDGQHAELLDAATGSVASTFSLPPIPAADGNPVAAFSPDSRQFAWALGDGRLARADVAAPTELHRHFGAAGGFVRLQWAADGNSLLTTAADGARLRWPIARFVMPE